MSNIRFTVDQLEVLDQILLTGSFIGAARALHRATSAVSYAVKTLERSLGVTLLDRSARVVALTPAGEVLIDAARDVLARSRQLQQVGSELRQGWEAQVDVVVDGALSLRRFTSALTAFYGLGAPTRVRLFTEHLSGVPRRSDDASLIASLVGPSGPTYIAHPLPPIRMVLVARHDHPAHAVEGALDRDRLSRWVEILVADSGRREEPPPHPMAQIGSPRLLEVSDFRAKRLAVLAGVGFGWLPVHLIRRSITSGLVRPLRFVEGAHYFLHPSLIHRRDEALGRGARCLRDLLLRASPRAAVSPGGRLSRLDDRADGG